MFGKIEWVTYFFTKKYAMERLENSLNEIFAIAKGVGAPELYPAHLAFQLYANGLTRQAGYIIEAAKRNYPELPYEKIPEFIAEDEASFQKGEQPRDIIRRRAEAMYLAFTGKPMDESLKDFLSAPPEEEQEDSVRQPGEFEINDLVIRKDGSVWGSVCGIDTNCLTGEVSLSIRTQDGRTLDGGRAYGPAQEFRLMTVEEKVTLHIVL